MSLESLLSKLRRLGKGDAQTDCWNAQGANDSLQETQPAKTQSATELLLQGLRELQCPVGEHVSEENHHYVEFTFQGGAFVAIIQDLAGIISICFPSIGDWNQNETDKIARLCNELSQTTYGAHFTCRSTDDNLITVDIFSLIWTVGLSSATETLLAVFNAMFTLQRKFCDTLANTEDDRSISNVFLDQTLVEFAKISNEHRDYNLQKDLDSDEFNSVFEHTDFTILDLLDTKFHIISSTIGEIDINLIYDNGVIDSISGDEARSLSLASLPAGGETAVTVVCRMELPGEERRRIMIVRIEDRDTMTGGGHRKTYAVTLMPENINHPKDTIDHHSGSAATMFSMLPSGVDKSNYIAEFKFMRDDALDKIKEGRENELTEAQLNMIRLNVTDLDYNIYMGTRAYNDGDYTRAVYYLNPASRKLLRIANRLNREQLHTSSKILYMTGVANSKAGDHERAFYFLEPLSKTGNPYYTLALIRALSVTGDFRARANTEHLLGKIEEAEGEIDGETFSDDGSDSQFYELRRILTKELVKQYIKDDLLDEAETILLPMKDGPDKEFAENMLAEIARLRRLDSSSQ